MSLGYCYGQLSRFALARSSYERARVLAADDPVWLRIIGTIDDMIAGFPPP
jgi:Flp pilus assembly protein TadD